MVLDGTVILLDYFPLRFTVFYTKIKQCTIYGNRGNGNLERCGSLYHCRRSQRVPKVPWDGRHRVSWQCQYPWEKHRLAAKLKILLEINLTVNVKPGNYTSNI